MIRWLNTRWAFFEASSLLERAITIGVIGVGLFTLVRSIPTVKDLWAVLFDEATWLGFLFQHPLEIISGVLLAAVAGLKNKLNPSIIRRYKKFCFFNSSEGSRIRNQIEEALVPGFQFEVCDKGIGISNPDLNICLVSEPFIPLKSFPYSAEYYAYVDGDGNPAGDARLRKLKQFVILKNINKGSIVINQPKIRLASELQFSKTAKGPVFKPVSLERTDYVSSLMTTEVAFTKISALAAEPPEELTDGLSSFVNQTGFARLRPLDDNQSANQIGVSTVAFTIDGRLLIVRQTPKNVQNKDLLVPSCSGSLDWDDLAKSKANDLLGVIRYGSKRELIEECGLRRQGIFTKRPEIGCEVLVIAFSRILNRGGKPEFFCLGRIEATGEEVKRRRRSLVERLFTRKVFFFQTPPIEVTDLAAISEKVTAYCENILEYGRRKNLNVHMSYQLEQALKFLIFACQHRKTEINSFLTSTLIRSKNGRTISRQNKSKSR